MSDPSEVQELTVEAAKKSPIASILMSIILGGQGVQLAMSSSLSGNSEVLQSTMTAVEKEVGDLHKNLEKLTDETRQDLRELRIQAAQREGVIALNTEQIRSLRDRLQSIESK